MRHLRAAGQINLHLQKEMSRLMQEGREISILEPPDGVAAGIEEAERDAKPLSHKQLDVTLFAIASQILLG